LQLLQSEDESTYEYSGFHNSQRVICETYVCWITCPLRLEAQVRAQPRVNQGIDCHRASPRVQLVDTEAKHETNSSGKTGAEWSTLLGFSLSLDFAIPIDLVVL
jgi:hypothetical protein